MVIIELAEGGYAIALNAGSESYPIWKDIYRFDGLNDVPFIAEDFSDRIFELCGSLPFNNDSLQQWDTARNEALDKLNKDKPAQ